MAMIVPVALVVLVSLVLLTAAGLWIDRSSDRRE